MSELDTLIRWLSAPAADESTEADLVALARRLESQTLVAAVPRLLPALVNWQRVTGGSETLDLIGWLLERDESMLLSATRAWLETHEPDMRVHLRRDLKSLWLVCPALRHLEPPPERAPELVIAADDERRYQPMVNALFVALARNAQLPVNVWAASMRDGIPRHRHAFSNGLFGALNELSRTPFLHGAEETIDDVFKRIGGQHLPPSFVLSGFEVSRFRRVVEVVTNADTELSLSDARAQSDDVQLDDELGERDERETTVLAAIVMRALMDA